MDLSQEGNSDVEHHNIEARGDNLNKVAFDAAMQACKEGLPEHLMNVRKVIDEEAAQKEINESLKKSIGNLGSFVAAVQFVQAKFNLNKSDAEKAVESFMSTELD